MLVKIYCLQRPEKNKIEAWAFTVLLLHLSWVSTNQLSYLDTTVDDAISMFWMTLFWRCGWRYFHYSGQCYFDVLDNAISTFWTRLFRRFGQHYFDRASVSRETLICRVRIAVAELSCIEALESHQNSNFLFVHGLLFRENATTGRLCSCRDGPTELQATQSELVVGCGSFDWPTIKTFS